SRPHHFEQSGDYEQEPSHGDFLSRPSCLRYGLPLVGRPPMFGLPSANLRPPAAIPAANADAALAHGLTNIVGTPTRAFTRLVPIEPIQGERIRHERNAISHDCTPIDRRSSPSRRAGRVHRR